MYIKLVKNKNGQKGKTGRSLFPGEAVGPEAIF